MTNELIFITHSLLVSASALAALWLGKEALVAFISVQCILANLFVIKQTTLCSLTATCSDAFSIGAVLGLNLLQEYYGREITKRTIWISFFLLIFYAAVSQLHLAYLPAVCDITQPYFAAILAAMPRIVAASFAVYLVVQHLDAWLYARLKTWTRGNYLVARTMISIAVCQLLDTVLFTYLGLYGIVANLGEIIAVSYIIKLVALVIAAPFVGLSKKIMRNAHQ